jgi:hypothetical protein
MLGRSTTEYVYVHTHTHTHTHLSDVYTVLDFMLGEWL